jgi:ribosome-binding protein aMBF1 (putative translation factor)
MPPLTICNKSHVWPILALLDLPMAFHWPTLPFAIRQTSLAWHFDTKFICQTGHNAETEPPILCQTTRRLADLRPPGAPASEPWQIARRSWQFVCYRRCQTWPIRRVAATCGGQRRPSRRLASDATGHPRSPGTPRRKAMPLLASPSAQVLLIQARQKLAMTQREFADALGSSVRTVGRWEGAESSPAPEQYHELAALLGPVDPARAHDAAVLGGKTLEELGLVEPPPPAMATPQTAMAALAPQPATPAPALPTRVLVDAVLFAAIDALRASPAAFDDVRAALQAAFAHARDLRLDPADVASALAPLPPPLPAEQAAPGEPSEAEPARATDTGGASRAPKATRLGRGGRKDRKLR